ncbi:hypothetical protein K7W42_02105 [Deinococcus sp. HMF7604]|uniref:hypothetical protein n=1 Tax=Deinococcus betulae TaxID=2873312 RepID=UPI001CCB53D8|nr:hypothetical protein [Deinococcus betulae]MBZ9749650.1 hypothetical protein [Deinococcus betulae]
MAIADNDRNGTDRDDNRGQGEGHQQIGNQQQPSGGARYREDDTPPHVEGGPGNERGQG